MTFNTRNVPPDHIPRGITRSKKILFSLLTVFIAWRLLEAVSFRYVRTVKQERPLDHINDPVYLFTNNSNLPWINAQGYRASGEFGETWPANTAVRIFGIGDSMVYGAGAEKDVIKRLEKKTTEHLQAHDPALTCEGINAAVSGWGVSQYVLRWTREGARFSPSLVFLGLCGNDDVDTFDFEKAIEQARSGDMRRYSEYIDAMAAYVEIRHENAFIRQLENLSDRLRYHSPFFNLVVSRYEMWENHRIKHGLNHDKFESRRKAYENRYEEVNRYYFGKLGELIDAVGPVPLFVCIYCSEAYCRTGEGPASLPREASFIELTSRFLENRDVPFVRIDEIYLEYLIRNPGITIDDFYNRNDNWHPSEFGTGVISESVMSHPFITGVIEKALHDRSGLDRSEK
jgi:hypothetical protein